MTKLTQIRLGRDKPEFDRLIDRLHLNGTYGADASAMRMAIRMSHKYLDWLESVVPNFSEAEWDFFLSSISLGKKLPPKPKSTGRPPKKELLDGHKVVPLPGQNVRQSDD